MGVAISPDGNKIEIEPKDKKVFTLFEISELLNGVVDLSFIDDTWIFANKLGKKLGLKFNEFASELFGYPIHGICLLIKMEELPAQLLIPKELPAWLQEKMDMYQQEFNFNIKKDQTKSFNDEDDADELMMNLKSLNENENIKEQVKPFMYETYEQLFNTDKSFDDILNNFTIKFSTGNIIKIPEKKDVRVALMDKFIDYFQDIEEYEICKRFSDLKAHIEEKD